MTPGRGKTLGSNSFDISPFISRVPPYSSLDIFVKLDAAKQETVDEHFEILVRDGEDLYF